MVRSNLNSENEDVNKKEERAEQEASAMAALLGMLLGGDTLESKYYPNSYAKCFSNPLAVFDTEKLIELDLVDPENFEKAREMQLQIHFYHVYGDGKHAVRTHMVDKVGICRKCTYDFTFALLDQVNKVMAMKSYIDLDTRTQVNIPE